MKVDAKQELSGPGRLPVLHRAGVAYLIDNRLLEFREISRTQPGSIDFRSPLGQTLLGDCTLVHCPCCGEALAFPEDAPDGEVSCRCGRQVSLQLAVRFWELDH